MVRVRVTNRVDGSAFDHLPWEEALPVWGRSFLAAFTAHPFAIRLLATEPVRDPSLIAVYSSVAAGLRRAGFPDDQIIAVITAAENFFVGSALNMTAPDIMVTPSSDGDADLLAALRAAPHGAGRAKLAFDVGIRALIGGFRDMLDEHRLSDHKPDPSDTG
ncbi:TetR/AcrR family transcriptional regulator C-terminal domain-containing protein [Mycolicibacterium sp. 120320]